MSIFIIVVLLVSILLLFKMKIFVHIDLKNFDSHIKIRLAFIKIEKKGTLGKRKKEHMIKHNLPKSSIKKKRMTNTKYEKLISAIEIDKLDINILAGTGELCSTVFLIPILSVTLEYLKLLKFKKMMGFRYKIMPLFEDIKIEASVDAVIKFKMIDVIKVLVHVNQFMPRRQS